MRRIGIASAAALGAMALTLVAIVATASANVVLSEKYPAVLSGTDTQGLNLQFSSGLVSKCLGGASGSASAPSSTVRVSLPTKEKCGYGATVATNGCTFALHPGAGSTHEGTFDIASGCTGLSTEYFGCAVNYPPQSGLHATFENTTWEGKSAVLVYLNGGGAEYTTSGLGCTSGTHHDGVIFGGWRIASFSEVGEYFGMHVTDPSGAFLAGEGSGSQFKLETYPGALSGRQTTVEKFEVAAGIAKCEQVNLGSAVKGATSEVIFEPEFAGCRAFGIFPTTLQVNGCQYVATVSSSGPYAGGMALSCPSGKQLEFNAGYGTCILSIPSQPIATSTYEVTGSGAERRIVTQMKGTGLEYTQSVGCPEGSGTFKNGVFGGAETLEGWS